MKDASAAVRRRILALLDDHEVVPWSVVRCRSGGSAQLTRLVLGQLTQARLVSQAPCGARYGCRGPVYWAGEAAPPEPVAPAEVRAVPVEVVMRAIVSARSEGDLPWLDDVQRGALHAGIVSQRILGRLLRPHKLSRDQIERALTMLLDHGRIWEVDPLTVSLQHPGRGRKPRYFGWGWGP